MILDPQTLSSGAVYRFLIGVVVPRPIAFVSTIGSHGANVAPFSYFMPIGSRPPLLAVSIGLRDGEIKDTLANIRETGDFVINVVTEALAERMVRASGDWPRDVDEFEVAGLARLPSDRVRSPRVAESPVNLECRLFREVALGDAALVVGELVCAHIDDALLVDGRVDVEKLRPLGRLGGDGYAPLREILHLPRPKIDRGGPPPAVA
jgi:flavin reductase (DIM6/NTAB) family NADH-FMN oxidoreductase RutF